MDFFSILLFWWNWNFFLIKSSNPRKQANITCYQTSCGNWTCKWFLIGYCYQVQVQLLSPVMNLQLLLVACSWENAQTFSQRKMMVIVKFWQEPHTSYCTCIYWMCKWQWDSVVWCRDMCIYLKYICADCDNRCSLCAAFIQVVTCDLGLLVGLLFVYGLSSPAESL